ncbi:hypothetical protein XAB3213_570010 [Xanthomonas citri pv. bilvae]|nr:hypothetical protein XAB3213_570010 [Xanthomonas citri pv. bilvae]
MAAKKLRAVVKQIWTTQRTQIADVVRLSRGKASPGRRRARIAKATMRVLAWGNAR